MLEVSDLTVTRGGIPVLEGVSLSLKRGQILRLTGPNGIGKTTVLRTIAGLQRPRAGHIEISEDSVAYAAHSDGLKATLTVGENLTFWAAIFGAGGVDHAMAAFELQALRDRPAQNLSAGQRRRLGLARLLVTGRPLWALDEPTVSLDNHSVGLFASAVAAHVVSGGAALIATHIDLGMDADGLDLSPFKARPPAFDDEDYL